MAVDWNWADNYLKRGRKKYERPLYDRGLRMWKTNKWDPDSDINVGWKWNVDSVFVIYHKDGTTTIQANTQTPGWWQPIRSQSVKLTLRRYGGIYAFQRNYKTYLQEDNAPVSAPKIQGCRKCKQSGLIDSWCSTYSCWDGKINDGVFTCATHPDATKPDINWNTWHTVPCPHGDISGHQVPKGQQCYSCNGSGKRDYGSKPERTQWDGTPLRLRDGKIIRSAATLLERMVADYAEPIG